MHRLAIVWLSTVSVAAALATGCAHHKANQYAYAPPLAPPVYPQPQNATPSPAGPVPGPVVAAPTIPGAPVIAGAPLAAADGIVPAHADGSCPPCAGVVTVAHEGVMQTQPCPQ